MRGAETSAEEAAKPLNEPARRRSAAPVFAADEDRTWQVAWRNTCDPSGTEVWASPANASSMSAASEHATQVVGRFVKTLGEIECVRQTARVGKGYSACKRLLDVAGALTALLVFGPLMLAIGVALCLKQGRPVLFSQRRAGLGGKSFYMLKFRTMRNGAELLRHRARALQDLPSGPCLKCRSDPRVTRLGRILRRWSLDELPQLFNVLAGQMSLVGPRPLPIYEVRIAGNAERTRLLAKPGLTCLWQIGGRNELPYDEWMALDALYVRNRSIWLDLLILIKTIPAVLSRHGAF